LALTFPRKTRDGKQRFAVPNKSFGQCVFLNDVSLEELCSVLKTHKEFIKSRFGSGEGKEAYVDAGDLGAEPEAYAKGDVKEEKPESVKRAGVEGDNLKEAAVEAGAVPVDGTGHVTNGVSFGCSLRYWGRC
jgi:3-dehydroquinate synthase